jgi:hypothetical protein
MGFTIEHVYEVSFESCIGWPKPVEYDPELHEDLYVEPVINGEFYSPLTGEMKLDNFTGYVRITYSQHRGMSGCAEDRKEKSGVIEENRKKVLAAFAKLW